VSMKPALYAFAVAFLAIGPVCVPSCAATGKASFSVSVVVLPRCGASASPMRFGSNAGTAVSAASTVSIKCSDTILTPYNVLLSAEPAPDAEVASGMNSAVPGNPVRSNRSGLFRIGKPTHVDTEAGSTGWAQTLSVPGQVPAGQFVAANPYADTMTLTITY